MAWQKILLTLTAISLGGANHIGLDNHGYSYVTRHDGGGHHSGNGGESGGGGGGDASHAHYAPFNGHTGSEGNVGGGDDDGGHHEDYNHHPKYKFEYGVKDHHTGDNKDAWETRDGDVVKGGYTVHEPDGTKLVVEYHADKHSGFNAIVKRVGHASHPEAYKSHHGGELGDENGGYGGNGGHSGHGAVSYSNIHQHN